MRAARDHEVWRNGCRLGIVTRLSKTAQMTTNTLLLPPTGLNYARKYNCGTVWGYLSRSVSPGSKTCCYTCDVRKSYEMVGM